jgi:predicted amidohydrolase
MIVAAPDGAIAGTYEKRHPWAPERWARRGRNPHPRLSIAGVNVTIAICYDLHFLPYEAETRETLRAVDLVLFPSAWVDTEDSRLPLLRDLARRFGVAIANANWSEGVVRLPGQGGSCILDARGEPLAVAGEGVVRIDATILPRAVR